MMLRFRTILIAVVVIVASIVGIARAWAAIGGGPMPLHGYIALTIGVVGTAALAWALMALAFRSDRDGWDERADRSADSDPETRDKP